MINAIQLALRKRHLFDVFDEFIAWPEIGIKKLFNGLLSGVVYEVLNL